MHLLSKARSQQVTSLKQLKAVLDTSLNAMQPFQRGSTIWQMLSDLCDRHRMVHRPVSKRDSVSLKSPSQLPQTDSVRRDVGNRRDVAVPLLLRSLKWCPQNRFEAQARGGWMGEPLSSCSVQRGRCSPRLLIWSLMNIVFGVQSQTARGWNQLLFKVQNIYSERVFRSGSSNPQYAKDWCLVHLKDKKKTTPLKYRT